MLPRIYIKLKKVFGWLPHLLSTTCWPNLLPTFRTHYSLDDSQVNFWKILDVLDQSLLENHINTTSCLQRSVCWTIKNSVSKVQNGVGTSEDKIIDGVASSEWVQKYLEGTMLSPAIKGGLQQNNCAKEYSTCKITQRGIQNLVKQISKTVGL